MNPVKLVVDKSNQARIRNAVEEYGRISKRIQHLKGLASRVRLEPYLHTDLLLAAAHREIHSLTITEEGITQILGIPVELDEYVRHWWVDIEESNPNRPALIRDTYEKPVRLNKDFVESMQVDTGRFGEPMRIQVLGPAGRQFVNIRMSQAIAKEMVETRMVRWPASWWQHFKRDILPAWFVRFFPVRYKHTTISVEAYYPRVTLSDFAHVLAVREYPDKIKRHSTAVFGRYLGGQPPKPKNENEEN